MLNTRDSMREGRNKRTNERTYTATKHITTLLLCSRVNKHSCTYFNKLLEKTKFNYKFIYYFGGGGDWAGKISNFTTYFRFLEILFISNKQNIAKY